MKRIGIVTSIKVLNLQTLPANSTFGLLEGETAMLEVYEGVLHPEIANLIPAHTRVTPVVSDGDLTIYHIEVRGYSVDSFVEIVDAFSVGKYAKAEKLIAEIPLPPSNRRN